jgi:hypothetical protein
MKIRMILVVCFLFQLNKSHAQDSHFGEHFLEWVKDKAGPRSRDLTDADLKVRWLNYYLLTYERIMKVSNHQDSVLTALERKTYTFENKCSTTNTLAIALKRREEAYEILNELLILEQYRPVSKIYFAQLDTIGNLASFNKNGFQQIGRQSFVESIVDEGKALSQNALDRYQFSVNLTLSENGTTEGGASAGGNSAGMVSTLAYAISESGAQISAATGMSAASASTAASTTAGVIAFIYIGYMIMETEKFHHQLDLLGQGFKLLPSKLIPIDSVYTISNKYQTQNQQNFLSIDTTYRSIDLKLTTRWKELFGFTLKRLKLTEAVLTKEKIAYLQQNYQVNGSVQSLFNEFLLIKTSTEMSAFLGDLYQLRNKAAKASGSELKNFEAIEEYNDALIEFSVIAHELRQQSTYIPYYSNLDKQLDFSNRELRTIKSRFERLNEPVLKPALTFSDSMGKTLRELTYQSLFFSGNRLTSGSSKKKIAFSAKLKYADNYSQWTKTAIDFNKIDRFKDDYAIKLAGLINDSAAETASLIGSQKDFAPVKAPSSIKTDIGFCMIYGNGGTYSCSSGGGNYGQGFDQSNSFDQSVLQRARDGGYYTDSRLGGKVRDKIDENLILRTTNLNTEYANLQPTLTAWNTTNSQFATGLNQRIQQGISENIGVFPHFEQTNNQILAQTNQEIDQILMERLTPQGIESALAVANVSRSIAQAMPAEHLRPSGPSVSGITLRQSVYDYSNSEIANKIKFESNKQHQSFTQARARFDENVRNGRPDPVYSKLEDLENADRYTNMCLRFASSIEKDLEQIRVNYPGLSDKIVQRWIQNAKISRLEAEGYKPQSNEDFPYTALDLDKMREGMKNTIQEMIDCNPIPDYACNTFTGRVMEKVYNLTDFKLPNGEFYQANLIAAKMAESPDWEIIGPATSQKANDAASYYATIGNPVVAVRMNLNENDHGHICVVLPGMGIEIPGYPNRADRVGYVENKVRYVANVANYSLNSPTLSFLQGRLDNAFTNPTGVIFYRRRIIVP